MVRPSVHALSGDALTSAALGSARGRPTGRWDRPGETPPSSFVGGKVFASAPGPSVDSAPELSLRRSIAPVVVLACLVGCAGWHGDTYVAHRSPPKLARKETTYRFGLPGGDWQPLNEPGAQVVWANSQYPAVIHLDSQCGKHGDSSIEQFADHLRIDFREWNVVSQAVEPLAGRDAVRTVVVGELDGVQQMQMELVILKKDGCLFDFQLLAPPAHFAQGKPDFDRVVAGFSYPIR